MKKPERLGRKLLYLTGAGVLVLLWQQLGLPCLLRSLTGIPCPGCGLTRAWLAALRLDIAEAFRWHPMFWFVPVILVYIVWDGKIFPGKGSNLLLLWALLAGFFLVYGARFFGFLGGFTLI